VGNRGYCGQPGLGNWGYCIGNKIHMVASVHRSIGGRSISKKRPITISWLRTRPHQEYFGKGITRVYFSGIYSYSRDFSVLPQYPYSVNEQWSDTRET